MPMLEALARWRPAGAIDLKAAGKPYGTCANCGRTGIRYLHTIAHVLKGQLQVGSECARHLCHGYDPERAESKLKAQWQRRSKWLTRNWGTSQNGNATLAFDHEGERVRVTVFRSQYGGYSYSIAVNGEPEFSPSSFPTTEHAKAAAISRVASIVKW